MASCFDRPDLDLSRFAERVFLRTRSGTGVAVYRHSDGTTGFLCRATDVAVTRTVRRTVSFKLRCRRCGVTVATCTTAEGERIATPCLCSDEREECEEENGSRHGGVWVRVRKLSHPLLHHSALASHAEVRRYCRSVSADDSATSHTATDAGDCGATVTSCLPVGLNATYRTRPDRESTAVGGSSMGGLISLHLCKWYPKVFGSAHAEVMVSFGGFGVAPFGNDCTKPAGPSPSQTR